MNKTKKLILVECTIIFSIILIFIILNSNINLQCYIEKTYGILCPSCGGTRMVIYLLTGHVGKAFIMHPVFFIGIVYLCFLNIVFMINSFRKDEVFKCIYPKMTYLIIFIITLLIFTIVRNMV